jgi:hypothetical protein
MLEPGYNHFAMATYRKQKFKGDQNSVIRKIVANPKKIGSYARKRFSLYRDGMTVTEYIAVCESACTAAERPKDALLDIQWDLDHNFIELLPPKR